MSIIGSARVRVYAIFVVTARERYRLQVERDGRAAEYGDPFAACQAAYRLAVCLAGGADPWEESEREAASEVLDTLGGLRADPRDCRVKAVECWRTVTATDAGFEYRTSLVGGRELDDISVAELADLVAAV